MTQHLILQKFEGISSDGQSYRLRPGDVVDDTGVPVTELRTYGLASIAWSAAYTNALAYFLEQYADDPDQGMSEIMTAQGVLPVTLHAALHILGGADEIDGDQLDIDYTPTSYTPGTTPAEVTNVDHLTAHLYGIDQQLGSLLAYIADLDPKASVRFATAAALPAYTAAGAGVGKTLTMNAVGALAVDGGAPNAGDRVLVNDTGTATGADRGIYVVTVPGDGATQAVLTRATDFDTDAEVTSNAFCFVEEGATLAGSGWRIATADPIVVDTTAISWVEFHRFEVAGNISQIDAGDAAAAGTRNTIARGDHQHAITTAAAGTTAIGDAAAEGAAASFSRSDHVHAVTAPAAPADVTKAAADAGVSANMARQDHKHDASTAAAGNIQFGDAAAEGAAISLARSDHTHGFAAPAAPADVTKAAASAGVAAEAARADHKHDASTAAAGTTAIGDAAAEGVATSLARSDHTHAVTVPAAPADVTKAAADAGASANFARQDHKHDASTAAAGNIQFGDAAAEGAASSFARSDHTHGFSAPAAPADVTKAAASAGVAAEAARADHKHDASTAAAGTTSIGAAAGEGVATSLARSDHTHAVTAPAAPANVTKAAADAGASANFARQDHKHDADTAAASSITGSNSEGASTSLARSDHGHKLAHLESFLAHQGIATGAGNAAAAGARNAHRTFDFDDGGATVDEQIAFEGVLPPHYSGGDITVVLSWVAASAVAGDVKWDVSWERMDAGVLDIDADGYAAAQTQTTTAPGTSGFIVETTLSFTQAQADAIVAGDLFRLLVMRDSNDAADTMVGDAQLLAVDIYQ